MAGGEEVEFLVFYDYSDTVFAPLSQTVEMIGIKDRAIRHEYPMNVPFAVTALLKQEVTIIYSDGVRYDNLHGDFNEDFNDDFNTGVKKETCRL